jgi:hypothetical protein
MEFQFDLDVQVTASAKETNALPQTRNTCTDTCTYGTYGTFE